MSEGQYSHTSRATGTVLTAAIYNADHVNHITNLTPIKVGGYSDSTGEKQTNTDPGGVGSEVTGGTLAAELEHIRFCIKRITGKTHWYEAPVSSLQDGAANDSITNAKLANMAAGTYKMRVTASTGDPEDGTAAQATAGLNAFVGDSGSGGTKGLVPAPTAGHGAAGRLLCADGTFKEVTKGAATQAQMETGTSLLEHVTPGRQHYHPGHPKAWGKADAAGAIQASYGVSSVTDGGTGNITWTWTTAFSSANYSCIPNVYEIAGNGVSCFVKNQVAGSAQSRSSASSNGAAFDPDNHFVVACGDQ